MSYINQISGNNIGDEDAREKIDDSNNGLRISIYHLAYAVEAIIRAIQYSEVSEDHYNITEAFKDLTGFGLHDGTPDYNEQFHQSLLTIQHIPEYTTNHYFTDKDGKNIF